MSWASKRTATRVEDVAYSLLGIFDVNMPLLYGEGEKAFTRLQEEIIRRTNDHTIFGWSTFDRTSNSSSSLSFTNLLATTPYVFKDDSNLVPKSFDDTRAYAMTNLGLETSLPVVPWAPSVLLVGLNCTKNSQERVYMFVLQQNTSQISVRAVYNGIVCLDQRGRFFSSIHRRLTIAIQLDSSTRALFDVLKLKRHPYLDYGPRSAAMELYTGMHQRRPLYGFHYMIKVSDYYYQRDPIDCLANITFVKLGFDYELNPICIISDHTYRNKEVPKWFEDIEILYTDGKDPREKTFWECTGLERTGWIRPETASSSNRAHKTENGVWALKGHHDSDSEFALVGDPPNDTWTVKFQRGWDYEMRPVFRVMLGTDSG